MVRILPFSDGLRRVFRQSCVLTLAVFSLLVCAFPFQGKVRANRFLERREAEPRSTQQVTPLEQGNPVARELSGGQKHKYQFTLAPGQYASVTVKQQGIDVLVRVLAPEGQEGQELVFDVERSNHGEEPVEVLAESGGTCSLIVEAKLPKAAPGTYQIQFVELRLATDRDRALREARRLLAECARLRLAGKYDEALVSAQRMLEIRQRELGPDHREVAVALNFLAILYRAKDENTKAESLHRRALAIQERAMGSEHPEVAATLNNIALILHFHAGDYDGAEQLYQRALAIWQKAFAPDHPYIPAVLNNIATVYVARGDYVKAEPLYQRALAIQERLMGQEHPDVARSLNNLGELYRKMGDFTKARSAYERSLAIYEQTLGPEHADVADVLGNLGLAYHNLGDNDKAESLQQRALKIREKELGPEHSTVAASLNNIGLLYFEKGDYAKAEPMYLRALAIQEKVLGPNHPDIAVPLNNLADLYALKGDLAESAAYQSRKLALNEYNLGVNLATGSERQKAAYLATLRDESDGNISFNLRFAPEQRQARELAATTIIQRKGRLQDAMSDSFASLLRRASPTDRAVLDQLNNTTSRLATLVLNGPQATLAEHQQRIRALEEERERLENEVNRRSAGYYQSSRPVTLASIEAAIPANAALIEFSLYRPFNPKKNTYEEPHYVAYVVRNRDDVRAKELGIARLIDGAIDEWRKALRNPKRMDVQKLARSVDERVMQPLRALFGDATHLLISPDGQLNLIPFEALVDERNRYLIERFACTYLTSGRDLLRLQAARTSRSAPVVIANPMFGEPETAAVNADRPRRASANRKRRSNSRQSSTTVSDLSNVYFAPLDGTAQEARAIKSLFAEATVLMGAQATEASLKRVAAPSLIHIATHGFFLTNTQTPSNTSEESTRGLSANVKIENPLLRSGLALAGANLHNGGGDDGILTALEASGLNLWGTKLVTLSACDTGLGEVRNGDGVYGLRRAFMLAGTETLVMSLWPVSDYVTRELMTAYYSGLKQGLGRGSALRQVQLGMLKLKDRQHPFYWASFIQAGEWGNLYGKR